MSDPLAAKAAFVAACAESIKCNQSHRIIFDRIFDKVGTGKKIPIRRKGPTQFRPAVPVARQNERRRARFRQRGCCPGIFVYLTVMSDISGVYDYIRCWIKSLGIGRPSVGPASGPGRPSNRSPAAVLCARADPGSAAGDGDVNITNSDSPGFDLLPHVRECDPKMAHFIA
jgi:hypothetical protein